MNSAAGSGHMASANAPRWRIVLVDDCADDAELVGIELAHGGIDAELVCVDNETGLRDALKSFGPQLVLSDIRMPGFSGQRAMELVREHAPTARFVFLSGDPVDYLHGEDPDTTSPPDGRLCKDDLGRLPELVRELLGD